MGSHRGEKFTGCIAALPLAFLACCTLLPLRLLPRRVRSWLRPHRASREEQYVYGLTSTEVSILARYNSERSRGIQHDPTWKAMMAELQRRFDAASRPNASPGGPPSPSQRSPRSVDQ